MKASAKPSHRTAWRHALRKFRGYQREAYQRGVTRVLEAHDFLETIKASGYVQIALNDIYLLLEQAVESLAEVSLHDLSDATRARISREGWAPPRSGKYRGD